MPVPGGSAPGGVWSRGGSGVSAPGGGDVCCSGGVPGGDPPPGRPLLRAVRILLECILVKSITKSTSQLWDVNDL